MVSDFRGKSYMRQYRPTRAQILRNSILRRRQLTIAGMIRGRFPSDHRRIMGGRIIRRPGMHPNERLHLADRMVAHTLNNQARRIQTLFRNYRRHQANIRLARYTPFVSRQLA